MEPTKVRNEKPQLSAEQLNAMHEIILQRMAGVSTSCLIFAEEKKAMLGKLENLARAVNAMIPCDKI